jgi:hypothetical protein
MVFFFFFFKKKKGKKNVRKSIDLLKITKKDIMDHNQMQN